MPGDGLTKSECDGVAATQPLVPREGETCYEFRVHGAEATDAFTVPAGESINRFHYDVPWPAGTTATRFGADLDNVDVVHHLLVLETASPAPAGVVSEPPQLGYGEDTALLTSWKVGGCHLAMPDGVAMELPDSGRMIAVAWHHFNDSGAPQLDRSAVQICTVPGGTRADVADMVWVPVDPDSVEGTTNRVDTHCPNESSTPVTLLALWSGLGGIAEMRTEILRVDGSTEPVFEGQVGLAAKMQRRFDPAPLLAPSDSIQTTCTVPFGSPSDGRCGQFALAYPANTLGTPTGSATPRTCTGK